MPLSVLHVSETDAGGGSARSAARIHEGLTRLGHTSRMLVGRRQTAGPAVRPLKRNLAWRALDRGAGAITDRLSLQYALYPSSFALVRDPWFREADVVQLYNTHGSYFSHTALPLLTRRRPLVWRLSDMWALTGHVAYSYDCERWRLGCGSCPYLREYPALSRDTTALLWRLKDAVYARSRLTVVAPSTWLETLVRESPLLGRFPVRRIPNGVDLGVFRPRPRAEARVRLGLPPDRPLLLFSALELGDRRKGAHVLVEALARLVDVDFDIVTAGAQELELPRRVHSLGRLSDDDRMAAAYAAADLFVLPTLAENLPNALLEAIACGTPCVSFAVGGVPDAVRPDETGALAPPGDAAGLAAAIRCLLADDERRERLARRCRETAEREFAAELEASRYAELYAELREAA